MVRTLITALLIAVPLLATSGMPADAQVSRPVHAGQPADPGQPASGARPADSRSVSVAVTKMTPDWAKPGSTITVQGTISNNTGSPIPGITVELYTSSFPFQDRSGMESYADGNSSSGYLASIPVGTAYRLPRELHTGVTMHWTASFQATNADYGGFGVYPLAAVADDAAQNTLATDQTLLPYWPGGNPSSPVNLAWIWPLVDKPQQSPCPQTLDTNSLAASLGTGGRLGGLLSSGVLWARKSDLTWAVDPALLSDAQTMTAPYKVGGNGGCTGTTAMPANAAASGWLRNLRANTATQPMFVTPYADADESALAHAGLDSNLQAAFSLGDAVAGQSLHRAFGKKGSGTGSEGAPSIAWPAGGTADEGVLTSLANAGDISTVVLGSNALPAAAPATVASTTTGVGTAAHVVLADSGLTTLLGSAPPGQGGQFATQQEFLAETAMIAVYATAKSVVVAPPSRWDPSAATASALLSMSTSAPWLRPASLSSLASSDAPSVQLPGHQVSGGELSGGYLNSVERVRASLSRYDSLLSAPSESTTGILRGALAATESSAWRGQGLGGGAARIFHYASFLDDSLRGVKLIVTDKKRLMGGASGDVFISVQNTLDSAVQVALQVRPAVASAGQMTVGHFQDPITVPAGKIATFRVPLHATGIETTTMQLQLVTRNGSPLGDPPQPMTVQVTRYGAALLILIGAALGVLVLTAAARWVRQWLKDTEAGSEAGSGGTG
jgi:hypothetical protein